MFEMRFTKFRIFQETILNPFKIPLDVSLSQTMGNMMVSLFFDLLISMAMRSSLLNDMILNREKVQCIFTFCQVMPACATNDAFAPV